MENLNAAESLCVALGVAKRVSGFQNLSCAAVPQSPEDVAPSSIPLRHPESHDYQLIGWKLIQWGRVSLPLHGSYDNLTSAPTTTHVP